MPDEMELFEVGDRVYLTTTKHLGTVVNMTIEKPFNQRDAVSGARRYNIKLDSGGTLRGVYHGIVRASG